MQIGRQFAIQLLCVTIQHTDVQWAKIIEETLIHQFIVDTKIMNCVRVHRNQFIFEHHQIQSIYGEQKMYEQNFEMFLSLCQTCREHLLGINSDAVAIRFAFCPSIIYLFCLFTISYSIMCYAHVVFRLFSIYFATILSIDSIFTAAYRQMLSICDNRR